MLGHVQQVHHLTFRSTLVRLFLTIVLCLGVATITLTSATPHIPRSAARHGMMPSRLAAASSCATTTTINLATYGGLYSDGTHADYNELVLQNLFNKVQPCTTILVPRGATYAHSRELVLNTPDVTIKPVGTGSDPVLLSTDVYTSGEKCTNPGWSYLGPCLAFIITGDRDSLSNLVVENAQKSQNDGGQHNPTEHGIVLRGDGQTLTNVTLLKSDWAGIETQGSTNLYLDHPAFWLAVNTSLSFHSGPSGPSGNVFVQDPLIMNSGDDGIAVESYIGGTIQHDIWVNGETYANSGTPTAGHGIAVVGGNRITFTNFSITNPPAAGIYVTDGQIWNDAGSNDVNLLTGTITNGNAWATAPPSGQSPIQQGAVVVQTTTNAPNQFVTGVDMENITLSNTATGVARQIWDIPYCTGCPPPKNVTFKNFTFSGTSPTTLFSPIGASFGTTPAGNYSISGWLLSNLLGTLLRLPDGQIILS